MATIIKHIGDTFLQDDINKRTRISFKPKPNSKFRKVYFRGLRKSLKRTLDKQDFEK
jgi:hypothetical protein